MLEIEATVVPGFESMAKEEIIEKLGSDNIEISRGHVNFYVSDMNLLNVLKLRSVDNLYFIVNRFKDVSFSNNKDECLQKICDLAPLVDWKMIIDTWQRFFSFKDTIDYYKILQLINISQTSALERISDKRNISVDKNNKVLNKFVTVQENLDNNILLSDDVYKNIDLCVGENKNNISDKELRNVYGNQLNDVNTSETSNASIDKMNDSFMSENKITSNVKLDQELISKDPKKNKERTIGMPSYRVTCNRNGTHAFQSPMAACEFGGVINDILKWNVDLDNFDLEIMLIINENQVKVGTGLTVKSLHRRDLIQFGKTSLRPTIAYGMLRLCHPLPGEIISDPMCGCGSIPIEAAISYSQCLHLAGDIDPISVVRSGNNILSINQNRSLQNLSPLLIDVFNWDSGRLPFKDNTIDIFITDLPFGKRMGSRATNWQLYPHVLLELARVSKLGGGRACLLTQDRKCIQHVINKLSNMWKRGPTVVTNIGGLTAAVFILYRTIAPFSPVDTI